MNLNFTKNIGMLLLGDLAHSHGSGSFHSRYAQHTSIASGHCGWCFHLTGQIIIFTLTLSASLLRG